MTILGRLASRSRPAETRAAGGSSTARLWAAYGPTRWSSGYGYISAETMLSVSVAQACMSLIAGQISSLPLRVERSNGEKIEAQPGWVRRPDPEMEASDWVMQVVMSLLVSGNAYILVGWEAGRIETLRVLDHDHVRCRGGRYGETRYWLAGGGHIPTGDMLHLRGMTLPGCLTGLGPMQYAARAMNVAVAEENYAANRFAEGRGGAAIPDGVLETDEVLDSDHPDEILDAWAAAQGGTRRGPVILDAGLKYKPLAMSAEQLQLVGSRKWTAVQQCQIFGVAPHLVAVPSPSSMTYSNVGQDIDLLTKMTLRRWASGIEEGLTRLHRPLDERVRFDWSELSRPAVVERYGLHTQALSAGWLTVDEVRAVEGLPPLTAPEPPLTAPEPPPSAIMDPEEAS